MEKSVKSVAITTYMIYAFIFIFIIVNISFETGKVSIATFLFFTSILAIALIKITSYKKYQVVANEIKSYEYYKDLDFKQFEPIHAGVITNKVKKIGIDGIIATVFLLEEKGIFDIHIEGNKYYISLSKVNIENINELYSYEKKIVMLFFSNSEDDRKLDLQCEIDKIKNDYNKKLEVKLICDEEQNNLISEAYTPFCELNALQEIIFGILIINSLFGFFPIIGGIVHNTNIILCVILYISSVLTNIYLARNKIIKIEYLEETRKLLGLFNYLKDYSIINQQEIKYTKLYEKFFLYAVGMGIADKFEKEFKQKSINNKLLLDLQILANNKFFQ